VSLKTGYMMASKSRVMVIGLDGATLDLILPWANAGHLPTLTRLMKNGGGSRLHSVSPVVSAAAWATFMTGTNPGKHGVFDFMYRKENDYRLRPTNSQHITNPSLWRLLSDQGRQVGVINVPMTFPPEEVNGILVSGLGTPNYKTFTHPPEYGERLLQEGYRVNRKMYYPENNLDGFLTDTYEIIDSITNAALRFIKEQTWDFFMVVYRDTDDVAHGFWRFMDSSHPKYDPDSIYKNAVLDLYKQLDKDIGDLVDAAGSDTTIFIISDHGFGPLYKDVYLNEWLRKNGFLSTKPIQARRNILSSLGFTRDYISRTLRKFHMHRVERAIKDIMGDRIEMLPRVRWPDFSEGIDWSKTRAYSFGYQGQIYVNMVGREPRGIINPGKDYETLIAELTDRLIKLVDPDDGKPVVTKIEYKKDIFHGPAIDSAPDIVITMRDLSYITRLGYELGNQPGKIFGDSSVNETGGHRLDGILIAAGPDISHTIEDPPSAWLGDIAPTVLHILKCSIPKEMDGRVLLEWLTPTHSKRTISIEQNELGSSAASSSELSEEDENEIMERLSDLGYLD
jgi:predicted AlkP superfamily phosphohydrolase/phosphomutase